jgi:hypothetical protein
MGAATAREAESIVYRRKSFRKKNSSPAILEPRGSAAGGTTNDSIAPNAQLLIFVYNMYGTLATLEPPDSESCLDATRSSFRQTLKKNSISQFRGLSLTSVETTHFLDCNREVQCCWHGFYQPGEVSHSSKGFRTTV